MINNVSYKVQSTRNVLRYRSPAHPIICLFLLVLGVFKYVSGLTPQHLAKLLKR